MVEALYLPVLCNGNAGANANSNNISFTIKDTKIYVSFVNLSAKGNQKLLKTLGKGFKRLVYWNEYKVIGEK